MTPRDILEVAEELAGGLTEAAWRAAVSRAYFAAFHSARNRLRLAGFDPPAADQAHSYLWLRLSNCSHPDVEEAGKNLKDLRQRRNWADYDLEKPFDQAMALRQIDIADRILGLLETVLGSASFAAITETMKTYERDVLRFVTWQP